MPVVFRYKGVRFFFYSNEGNPREPAHVHALAADGEAKFWLYPDVRIAECRGFDRRMQAELVQVVESKRDEIKRAWDEHFC